MLVLMPLSRQRKGAGGPCSLSKICHPAQNVSSDPDEMIRNIRVVDVLFAHHNYALDSFIVICGKEEIDFWSAELEEYL